MNWLDAVIAIIILAVAYVGWKIGIVRAAVALGGTALGLFLAGQYYDDLGRQLERLIDAPNGAKVAAFLIIFAAVVVGAILVGKAVRRLLQVILLEWVDRVGGALLGALVGAALSTGLAAGLQAFPVLDLSRAVRDSLLADFLLRHYPAVLALLPKEFDIKYPQ